MSIHVFRLTLVAIMMALCFLVSSAFTMPLTRRERFGILRVLKEDAQKTYGCTKPQILQLQEIIKTAHEWAKNADDLFEETDIKVLRESEGAQTWLSRDGTKATGAAFPPDNVVPLAIVHRNVVNDLKIDGKLRLGNVAESYNLRAQPASLLVPMTFKLPEAMSQDTQKSFIFICAPEETTNTRLKEICRTGTYAMTQARYNYMVLCHLFFSPLKDEDPSKAVKDAIESDKQKYLSAKNEGKIFPQPTNPVSTLLHEAQHSKRLLNSNDMRNELKDFPNDGRGLNPQDLANEEVIKPEDRSRSPENWGLVPFLIHVDRELFTKPKA